MMKPLNTKPDNDSRTAFVGNCAFPFSAPVLASVESVKESTGADIVVGNLESPLVLQDTRRKLINLYSTTSLGEFTPQQGVSTVSPANNHVMDYGKEGVRQLLNLLHEFMIQSDAISMSFRRRG